ncbi:conserved hypothetical protein [Paraburkholderia caribensis]|nr:conserved hypothetical protein [Paraburkholderia caribensis]
MLCAGRAAGAVVLALARKLSAVADPFMKRGVAACQRFATGAS